MRRWLAMASLAGVTVCGGSAAVDSTKDTTGTTAKNPLPSLVEASPTRLPLGGAGTTVTLTGSGFISETQVAVDGQLHSATVINASTISVDFTAADLAIARTISVIVMNPAPGGGNSGVLSLTIAFPPPVITRLAPDSVTLRSSSVFKITIIGTGFTASSGARVNGVGIPITSRSATRIDVDIAASLASVAGRLPVIVVNPANEGGVSESKLLTIGNPEPTLLAVSPDTAFTATPLTMAAFGSEFEVGAVIQWNGSPLQTTRIDASHLTATVPDQNHAYAGTGFVGVANPGPGGGVSRTFPVQIRPSPPRVNSVSPASAIAGGAGVSIDITGERFDPAVVARVNGQSRALQFVSPTLVRLQFTASDVATSGTIQIVLINPGAIESAPVLLPVLSSSASLTQIATVFLANRDVVYDSLRNVFYASVQGAVPTRGNTITRISTTGQIQASVSVGKEPGKMVISDDGQYLYVARTGEAGIARVNLGTFAVDLVFQLGTGAQGGPLYAEDLAVVPGNAHRVVVALRNLCCSPWHEGVALFIDGVRAPVVTPRYPESNRITFAGAVDRIYGVSIEGAGGMNRLLLSDDGVRIESFFALPMCCEFVSANGRIYTDNGVIVDVRTMTQVGTINASGRVRPDPAKGRIYFLTTSAILTIGTASLLPIATPFTSPFIQNGLTSLVRWGADGLAVGGGSFIVIFRGELAGP